MKKVGLALLGLGTVGGGTYRIIKNNHDMIAKTEGIDLQVLCVLEKNVARAKELGVDLSIVGTDIDKVINNPEISIVAEFFGGIEPARTFLIKSLLAGKSVVTANKELIAKHWHELEEAAKKGKAGLYFEASCVGGVPIIRTLTEGMQANNIMSIKGIINGTTNYILTKMAESGQSYESALKEAQDLGYAEANPSADVDGYDASYKISILSSLAFRTKVPLEKVYREGISKVTAEDIAYGKEFGLTLKLLGIAKMTDGKVDVRVHPVFIPDLHPLAAVRGSFNAVHLIGDAVGDIMLYGRGAGDLPTGSAIVSDIVFAATQKKHKYSPFNNTGKHLSDKGFIKDFKSEYYIRMTVNDKSGMLAKITSAFGKQNISITTVTQKPGTDIVPLVFITHETHESSVNKALAEIVKCDGVVSIDNVIRVERD